MLLLHGDTPAYEGVEPVDTESTVLADQNTNVIESKDSATAVVPNELQTSVSQLIVSGNYFLFYFISFDDV